MKRHIARLENYVNTMNDLQHLENIEIQKKAVEIGNIVKQMNSIGASVCLTKKFLFKEKPLCYCLVIYVAFFQKINKVSLIHLVYYK